MPAKPITWKNSHFCADRRGNASADAPPFVDSLGGELRMWDVLRRSGIDGALSFSPHGDCQWTSKHAFRTIAMLTISENAGHLPAAEMPDTFGGAISSFIGVTERTARD